MKPCPACKELLPAGVSACRHCGHGDITPAEIAALAKELKEAAMERKRGEGAGRVTARGLSQGALRQYVTGLGKNVFVLRPIE